MNTIDHSLVFLRTENARMGFKELKENNYVLAVYELVGEFDLAVEFASPNPSKFNKEFKKVITANSLLKEYKIVLNIVTHFYPRQYLIKSSELLSLYSQKIVGGDREKDEFTAEEMNILRILLHNPTIRYTKLAKEAGLNIKTAKSILNHLIQRNIVRGCKYLIDKDKLGVSKIRLFLKLHNMDLEHEARLLDYLRNLTEIIQVNKTVGDWDMEIDLESLDKSRIRYIISKLREEFSTVISNFNLIEVYDYYKRTYLPEYLFRKE